MGLFTKDIKTFDDLFLHGLQDIYYAENQITKALPKMIDMATNRDLSSNLSAHLEETRKQIERLDKVFEKLGKEPGGAQCPAIDGLIKEADHTASEIEDKAVLDAAIVASAQAVEHYEICRYGTLIAWAGQLGHKDVVRFLTTNLNEEKGGQHQTQYGGPAQGRQLRSGLTAVEHLAKTPARSPGSSGEWGPSHGKGSIDP
jgi:ferritin-like metal-binding protein YciE